MTERLLQFIWQFQYFNKSELTASTGEPVQIIFAGQYNTNQGPDFLDAKIKIGTATWAGNIELHIKTTDWQKHNHDADKNYNNVILHVVWEDNGGWNSVPASNEQHNTVPANATERSSIVPDGGWNSVPASNEQNNSVPANATERSSIVRVSIPLIELKDRVSKILLQRYEELMNSLSFIPCEKSIATVKEITWKSWKERLLAERLLRKAAIADTYLQQNNYHWEETFWWLLARNFGIKVNADLFEAIARTIPINVLAKHKNQVHQLEALLLGQAGLLNDKFADDYPQLLQREYKFLKEKYKLSPVHQPVHFLRMRPGNFPTIRLAQLAILVQQSSHLFSKIKEAASVKEVKSWFDVTANDYWHYHYRFDEMTTFKKKKPGDAMMDNIIINTVCPVLFAYGNYHKEQQYKDKALQWLEQTKAESNYITKGFMQIHIENKNGYDSQALIELKNEYCNKKKCLDCSVGNAILKK